MSLHWAHVAAAWGLTALVFGGLALGAARRHRAAKRRLALLETER
jgi:heme exporter protein CcmD